jgi:CP family cyanate transporter-like MFS transporter
VNSNNRALIPRLLGGLNVSEPTHKFSWFILGCAWLVALFLYVLMQCVSPLLPVLIDEFNLSHSMAGFLYSLPILMIALFSYPLGIASDKIGMEVAVGLGATVAILASLARPLSLNFSLLLLSTAVFGLGFALCFPNLPKLVKENFPQRLSGTATGVYITGIPLGSGLSIALAKPVLAATGSWRTVVLIWSLIAIPAILLWWLAGQASHKRKRRTHSGPVEVSTKVDPIPVSPGGSLRSVLISGMLLSLLNLIFYCTLGWLPTYLSEKGWSPTMAGAVTSTVSFTEIPGIILLPLLCDRIGKKREIIGLSFLLIAISSGIVALVSPLSWFVSPILGFNFGGVFALLLAIPAQLVERDKVGRVAGAIISIGYVGALVGPPALGYLRDLMGSFSMGFLILGFVGLMSTSLSFTLPGSKSPRS